MSALRYSSLSELWTLNSSPHPWLKLSSGLALGNIANFVKILCAFVPFSESFVLFVVNPS